ncbi:MAG: acyltransferase family protein [Alsobacter sp.]
MSTDVAIRNEGPAAGRHGFVDYAKGLCIILVVMLHSTKGVGEAMGGDGFLHAVVEFARPFRIPAFFVVAGLFMARALQRSWPDYLDRKVVYFVYFYGLWVIIHFLVRSPGLIAHGDYAVMLQFVLAPVQPYSMLWFIYLLPVFFLAGRLFRDVPAPLVFLAAALLETARIQTGWTLVDHFAARWVYFVAGATLAPAVFSMTRQVVARPAWAAGLIFSFAMVDAALTTTFMADGIRVSAMPGLSLALGLTGAAALIAVSALLARFGMAGWIAFCGQRSLIIYVAFFLPMAGVRAVLVSAGLVTDIGIVSLLVTAAAVGGALLLERVTRSTPLRILFKRPDWFRLTTLQSLRARSAD